MEIILNSQVVLPSYREGGRGTIDELMRQPVGGERQEEWVTTAALGMILDVCVVAIDPPLALTPSTDGVLSVLTPGREGDNSRGEAVRKMLTEASSAPAPQSAADLGTLGRVLPPSTERVVAVQSMVQAEASSLDADGMGVVIDDDKVAEGAATGQNMNTDTGDAAALGMILDVCVVTIDPPLTLTPSTDGAQRVLTPWREGDNSRGEAVRKMLTEASSAPAPQSAADLGTLGRVLPPSTERVVAVQSMVQAEASSLDADGMGVVIDDDKVAEGAATGQNMNTDTGDAAALGMILDVCVVTIDPPLTLTPSTDGAQRVLTPWREGDNSRGEAVRKMLTEASSAPAPQPAADLATLGRVLPPSTERVIAVQSMVQAEASSLDAKGMSAVIDDDKVAEVAVTGQNMNTGTGDAAANKQTEIIDDKNTSSNTVSTQDQDTQLSQDGGDAPLETNDLEGDTGDDEDSDQNPRQLLYRFNSWNGEHAVKISLRQKQDNKTMMFAPSSERVHSQLATNWLATDSTDAWVLLDTDEETR